MVANVFLSHRFGIMSNKRLSKPSNPSQSDLGVKMGKCEKSIGGSREFKAHWPHRSSCIQCSWPNVYTLLFL